MSKHGRTASGEQLEMHAALASLDMALVQRAVTDVPEDEHQIIKRTYRTWTTETTVATAARVTERAVRAKKAHIKAR